MEALELNIKILLPAKKGLTLIWPLLEFYTRGIVSKTNEKFIITGWYSLIK